MNRPFKLQCPVQHYDWGVPGERSLIASLVNGDLSERYAELWMGAHSSASAIVVSSGQSLRELISSDPRQFLGASCLESFGSELPFLLKVLTAERALSIQAHPDRSLAEKLHVKDPGHYPDANHKPEIAIALTGLEYLCGFRPPVEIANWINRLSMLQEIVPPALRERLAGGDESALVPSYRRVFELSPERLSELCGALAQLFSQSGAITPEERWVLRLSEQYPDGDAGLFSFFFLNYGELNPGEAFCTVPNVPHAYLEGEIIECMANSDNVVRAGLTTKFVDVDVLLEMIPGCSHHVDVRTPIPLNGSQFVRYETDIKEFVVDVAHGALSREELVTAAGPTMLFVLRGGGELECGERGETFSAGDVFFIPASCRSIRATSPDCVLYRAVMNSDN